MKPGRIIFPIITVLAAILFLLICTGFAQQSRPENDASKYSIKKETVVNDDGSANSYCKTISRQANTAISFLPTDIFASFEPKVVEMRNPTSTTEPAASKGAGRGDNDDRAGLAKKLLNPVSSLASISFRNSFDFFLAADREGWHYTMNFEPAFPISLGKNWNLISRTVLPIIQQDGILESTTQTGLGDMLQRFLLAPAKSKPIFWGVGTTLLLPTATDTRIGAGKFGLGPTLAIGRQQRAWSYGVLAHQIWSVAGHRDRADVRSAFIQPFVAYTTKSAWTYSLYTESTYDWVGKNWSIPIHLEATKIVRFVRQPVSVGAALRCWAATPPGGPQGCGFRFVIAPVFPARQ